MINNKLKEWFGSTYSSFLTIPMVFIAEMSQEWQEKLACLLIEYDQSHSGQPELEPEDNYIVGRSELCCFKKVKEDFLFSETGFCEISFHTMDRDDGELEEYCVTINGSGNVHLQFYSKNEKFCRLKFNELLGHEVLDYKIILSLGFKTP